MFTSASHKFAQFCDICYMCEFCDGDSVSYLDNSAIFAISVISVMVVL